MKYEDAIRKIARTLVREFKNDKSTIIPVENSLTWVGCSKSGYYFREGDDKLNIYIGDLDDEGLAKATCDIAKEIDAMLKLPKKVLKFKDEREHSRWTGWSSRKYTSVKKYIILTPCKQFLDINKKLSKLRLKPISFEKWYFAEVAGKRADIFSMDKTYYAVSEKKCSDVLAYLKGKKKLSYELYDENHYDDRDYGIEHETEWYGSMTVRIKFTESSGKIVII